MIDAPTVEYVLDILSVLIISYFLVTVYSEWKD